MVAIERETASGSPDRGARMWLENLAEADKSAPATRRWPRSRSYFDKLRPKLDKPEETREVAPRELEGLVTQKERAAQYRR